MPWATHVTCQHFIGFFIINKCFIFRIPLKFSSKSNGNICLMTHCIRACCNIYRAYGIPPGFYRIKKIPAMIIASGQLDLIRSDNRFQLRFRTGINKSSLDHNVTFGSHKHDPHGIQCIQGFFLPGRNMIHIDQINSISIGMLCPPP